MPALNCQECGKSLLSTSSKGGNDPCVCSDCGREVFVQEAAQVKIQCPNCGEENEKIATLWTASLWKHVTILGLIAMALLRVELGPIFGYYVTLSMRKFEKQIVDGIDFLKEKQEWTNLSS